MSQFLFGSRTELRDLMQQRAQPHPEQQPDLKHQQAIRVAAEHVLRDSQRLDPRWRDPLSPSAQRRAAVVRTLTEAITEARRGTANAALTPLAHIPSTDEATLLSLYDTTVGWGSIQTYFDLPDTTEIKFVGTQVQIFSSGQPPVIVANPLSIAETEQRARILAQDANQPVNANEPQRSLALGYGTRVTMVLHPRAIRPFLTFRRGRTEPWSLDTLIERGTLNEPIGQLLRFLLRARLSVVTVGATGSGKTVLLETLLNEADGHIVTIEDGAQELTLRPTKLWTPQVVDILSQQQALTDALLGVLRQTPDVVAVGECRGSEAGAILSLATTDHQILFTIHAEDARGALRRFASRATIRGADYEGRFEDALQDAVQSLSVVIVQQYWGQVGRRLVTELALAAGVERDEQGSLQPILIPLAQAFVDPHTRAIDWQLHVQVNAQGDGLELSDSQALPTWLAKKIQMGIYRTWSAGHVAQTGLARIEAAIERATSALQAGRTTQALSEARSAWGIRADLERLVPLVQRILSADPLLAQPLQQTANATHCLLHELLQNHRWDVALEHLRTVETDPALLAFPPSHGWQAITEQIQHGLATWATFDSLMEHIPFRIQAGAVRETLEELDLIMVAHLDESRIIKRLGGRILLLEWLVAQGQATSEALQSAQAQFKARTLHEENYA